MRSRARIGLGIVVVAWACGGRTSVAEETRAPVALSGGRDTDCRDGGRPVALVAGGLGVKSEVFREAFRGVTPGAQRPSFTAYGG